MFLQEVKYLTQKKNEKFKHKLEFLNEFLKYSEKNKDKLNIFCGDFNVAPFEEDVWSHKHLRNVVSHTEIERNTVLKILKKGNLIDLIRMEIKPPKNLFTWWSYRSPDYKKNNRGRRLDHIWVTDLKKLKTSYSKILIEFRDNLKPSDHVPIMSIIEKI